MSDGIRFPGSSNISTLEQPVIAETEADSLPQLQSPVNQEPVQPNNNPLPRGLGDAMRGDLGFLGKMTQSVLQNALPTTTNSAAPSYADRPVYRFAMLPSRLVEAKIPSDVRDQFMDLVNQKSQGANRTALMDQADKALASKDPTAAIKGILQQEKADAEMTKKIDKAFESFNTTYEVDGKKIQATPHFRMPNGMSGPPGRTNVAYVMQDLKKTIQDQDKGKPKNEQLWNSKMQEAVKHAAYGKPSAEELKLVTEALIKSGKLQETKSHYTSALTDSEAIRMMQWENGIGIDCSGFVSQAFVKAHGGTHDKYKLQNPMNENLMDLKHNSKFTPVKPVDVRPGDLITLDKPAPNDVGHTVLVREHHMADYDVLKNLPNGTSFAGANDKIHSYKVDASWGASSNGWLGGGVQTKVWLYNETTGKWAMLNQKNPGGLTVEESSMSGPYNHPMNGIYRPKP